MSIVDRTAALTDMLLDMERIVGPALGSAPVALPPEFAGARGHWRGEEARIDSRARAGGLVRWMRATRVLGDGLCIANLLVLPDPATRLPILGLDAVAIGGRDLLLAVDLSPSIVGPERAAHERAIARAVGHPAQFPSAGELPGWAQGWFSASATFARVPEEQLLVATRVAVRYAEALVSIATDSSLPGSAADAEAVQARYLEAHRRDDRGLRMLHAMFGAHWAAQYIDTILFPAEQWSTT